MALNWIITVGAPVLTQGMSFQVSYRKLPSTNWVPFLPNPTTNTFTIPNLDENGEYEAEIKTICANGEASLPIYHNNSLTPPTVILRWNDNQGNEDRTCTQSSCNVNIEIVTTDPDQLITNIDILKSTDNGLTWITFASNQAAQTFTDDITMVGLNKYKAVITDITGATAESNVMTYKGSSIVNVDHNPDVFINVYKADSNSHYVAQVKFYGLQVSTVDSSNIVKVEVFAKFRAIGENIWFQTTETHIVPAPTPSLSLNRQFVYGFKDPNRYVGTRDWNGADSAYVEFKIYTSSGEVKIITTASLNIPWYNDYNQAIT
ncbi:fibronectin type III domain-containing protein [Chryseobacterium soli]|uniref:fibronectin type III domain-containing protein n=1 Tax=Chryseobacterium soli TaxID=445961 RepID=UPI002954360C|nr:fibronectin type III domain-containing protein [Chryseobacterium soli]MDV7696293.1 fibronectin type III domain-containing protein [Chryseobacterium soli]